MRAPMPPSYMFVIDVSVAAVACGMLTAVVDGIKSALDELVRPEPSSSLQACCLLLEPPPISSRVVVCPLHSCQTCVSKKGTTCGRATMRGDGLRGLSATTHFALQPVVSPHSSVRMSMGQCGASCGHSARLLAVSPTSGARQPAAHCKTSGMACCTTSMAVRHQGLLIAA